MNTAWMTSPVLCRKVSWNAREKNSLDYRVICTSRSDNQVTSRDYRVICTTRRDNRVASSLE
jgi:ribosomal silencing factor RsfS